MQAPRPPILTAALIALALAGPLRAETATAPPPAITVVTAAEATLAERVVASGLIAPVEEVAVQPQIEGQAIDALLADLGDTVAAGQVLARLSDAALVLARSQLLAGQAAAEAAVAQARAQITEAEANRDEAIRARDRVAALRAQGVAAQTAADQAAAAATAAEARVALARQGLAGAEAQVAVTVAQLADVDLKLSRTQVKAPVAGAVVARNAVLGAIASAQGQPMFVLIRDGALELRADVAESDLLRLAPGQVVALRVAGADAPIPGHVRLVEPAIDRATRLGRVRIAIDTPQAVRSGMFAQAEILITRRSALAVPVAAVGRSTNGPTVLRVRDGVAEEVAVTTGIRDGALIEVASGLSPGDSVVARAGAFVRPGDRITPVPAAAPAAATH
ncbi:efflux RND transporter periplasmic adaptor subunit [Ruixingdingia sedimenti]|uniref:Efflux RND transporter periplasmic adaptor subunit n=1 Tax=Ruixingdingia sedimenti TaxID=3073604 RepID=A0ABU1F5F2_9RHOB|nr:efflux RND transporter periplasmic adaptor subunit [Xinfangfangia sp. LG-4]MDR5651669.1 efflux RND transporter periplasmic adaptor subunit [Xinfangfangia sp. LG-4]